MGVEVDWDDRRRWVLLTDDSDRTMRIPIREVEELCDVLANHDPSERFLTSSESGSVAMPAAFLDSVRLMHHLHPPLVFHDCECDACAGLLDGLPLVGVYYVYEPSEQSLSRYSTTRSWQAFMGPPDPVLWFGAFEPGQQIQLGPEDFLPLEAGLRPMITFGKLQM